MTATEPQGRPKAADEPWEAGLRVLRPGHNCWAVESSERAAAIVDTAAYFRAFDEACRMAERQILILGWDFDRHERLYRDQERRELPDALGAFLAALVRRRKGLRVYLLSWDFNMIYAAERELLPALRLRLQAPPRFHFRLDARHPGGASHHQKVVVIDDRVAFVGGIDLSRWRWDTSEHMPDDPRRIDPNGRPYPPFHDMMMLVEGPVAARLGDLARERWRRARGWRIRPPSTAGSRWPASVTPQLHGTAVAISRTEPAYAGRAAVAEVRRLYLDAIAAARRFIYIENQYFTALELADALADRLRQADGPEVVLVLPQHTGGWLEQVTMDVLRGRVVARLHEADRNDRLRIYYAYQPGLGEACISVHAKLLIVDDRLVRIGSSNTSNRSMGLDTECDLSVEAAAAGDEVAAFATALRRDLLAEHLGCAPADVAEAEARQGGLIAAIESLRGDGRSLRDLDCRVDPAVDDMLPDTTLVDPPEPISPDYFVAEYVPRERRAVGRRRLLAFLAVIVGLLLLAAAWRWTPLGDWLTPGRVRELFAGVASPYLRGVLAIAGMTAAALLMVPLTFLALVGGIVFPTWVGFAYVLLGASAAAALGFAAGRWLSGGAVARLGGRHMARLRRQLQRRGTVAVAVLRLMPIAPFAVFNLVAGASAMRFRQFFVGSLLGLAPGIAGITFFSGSLWAAVTQPTWGNVAVAALVAGLLIGVALLAKRWLRSG